MAYKFNPFTGTFDDAGISASSAYAFGIVQPDSGSTITADSLSDILSLTNDDGNIDIYGIGFSDTIRFRVPKVTTLWNQVFGWIADGYLYHPVAGTTYEKTYAPVGISGADNTVIGYASGLAFSDAYQNVVYGSYNLQEAVDNTVNSNTVIGCYNLEGINSTINNMVVVGQSTMDYNNPVVLPTNSVILGNRNLSADKASTTNSVIISSDTASINPFAGIGAVDGYTIVGMDSGKRLTDNDYGINIFGFSCGNDLTGGAYSVLLFGRECEPTSSTAAYEIAFGSPNYPYQTVWFSSGGKRTDGAGVDDFYIRALPDKLTADQSASGQYLHICAPRSTGLGYGGTLDFMVCPPNTISSSNINADFSIFSLDSLKNAYLNTSTIKVSSQSTINTNFLIYAASSQTADYINTKSSLGVTNFGIGVTGQIFTGQTAPTTNTRVAFTAASSGEVVQANKAAASQTADLFRCLNSSGSGVGGFSASGRLYTGSSVAISATQLSVTSESNTTVGMRIKSNATPSVNLYEYQNSSSTVQAGMSSDFRTFWGTTAAVASRSHFFQSLATSSHTLTLRAIASQTSQMLTSEDSSGNILAGITTGGQIYATFGTASTAGYSFINAGTVDTDTGFYSNSANEIDVTTGGTRRACFTSNGRLNYGGNFSTNSATVQISAQTTSLAALQVRKSTGTMTANIITVSDNPGTTEIASITANGDMKLSAVGAGYYCKEGTNACMGTATMVGGTVTVNTTKVTANSRIFLTIQTAGGTLGSVYISARTAGTSFTITSSSALDTSTVAWFLVEPS